MQFKGLANASPGAPDIVVMKGNEKYHVATFEFTLTSPNQWANVTLEVQGHANKDGKPVADDVNATKIWRSSCMSPASKVCVSNSSVMDRALIFPSDMV